MSEVNEINGQIAPVGLQSASLLITLSRSREKDLTRIQELSLKQGQSFYNHVIEKLGKRCNDYIALARDYVNE